MYWQQWKLELNIGEKKVNKLTKRIIIDWTDKRLHKLCYIGFTFGVYELNNYIILENVNFLNCRNSIHSYSLQGALKSFVISCGRLVDSFLLSVGERKRVYFKCNPILMTKLKLLPNESKINSSGRNYTHTTTTGNTRCWIFDYKWNKALRKVLVSSASC